MAGEGFTGSQSLSGTQKGDEVTIIMTDYDFNTFVSGSGLLVEVLFTVINDTAGTMPIMFDTLYAETRNPQSGVDECISEGAPLTPIITFTCHDGGITFLPTAHLNLSLVLI